MSIYFTQITCTLLNISICIEVNYISFIGLTQLSLYPHISVMMSRYGTPVTVNCTQSYPTARIIWIGYYKGGTVKLGFPEDNQLASSGVQIVDRGNYFSKLTFGGEDHTLSSVQCQSFNINRNPIFSNRLTIALYGKLISSCAAMAIKNAYLILWFCVVY